ncbi:MAG: hypothetical protein ACO1OT_06840 [Heyndrickxia sp.]
MIDGYTLPNLISLIRVESESDWPDLSIPQTTFEQYYPFKYLLIKEINPWLAKINEVLIRIAETIYKHSLFELAMKGEEISGDKKQEEITFEDVKGITSILPIPRQGRENGLHFLITY